jgi:UDP-N-acetylglucosamine diphosphorylase / glucose-1-phosphate thymidylyltransferase / UDP-N-acetylgalactosamine diphosphorylase / glucosamine-1-phosphate N-acetyltransferase / galactosamine-1-phosphate N-acetyltransferase
MNICIFEDEKYRKLLPLVYFRPVYELRCGINLLKDKIIRSFSNPNVILHARDYLTDVLKRDYPNYYVNELPPNANQVLFVNGRVLADPHFADKFKYNGKDIAYVKGDDIVAFWASGENLEKFKNKFGTPLTKSDFENYEKVEISAKLINYPWDIINNNGEQIVIDFNILTDGKARREGKIYEGVHLLNEHFIHIEEGAKIKPGVVLDAENGPIYIGKMLKFYLTR